MIQAAIDTISRTGLTVSLDHISFEDLIREAGVSRSTAYRHWPYKDLFFVELVEQLVNHAGPEIIRGEVELARRVLAAHPDWLATPELRHQLLLELMRELAMLDFRAVLDSPQWRTYLALHATVSSLPDDQLRARFRAALARAEADHTAKVARAWEQLSSVFGYRLRPEVDAGFDDLATLLSATMNGLVITALTRPEAPEHRAATRPFGATTTSEWSLPALGFAAIATAFIEPDPAAGWSPKRLTEIHRILDEWAGGDP